MLLQTNVVCFCAKFCILLSFTTISTLAGESATFEVILATAPDSVVWLKDNRPLSESKSKSIRSTKSNGDHAYRLEIKNAESADAGLYTAIATNAVGKAACSAPLVVHGC